MSMVGEAGQKPPMRASSVTQRSVARGAIGRTGGRAINAVRRPVSSSRDEHDQVTHAHSRRPSQDRLNSAPKRELASSNPEPPRAGSRPLSRRRSTRRSITQVGFSGDAERMRLWMESKGLLVPRAGAT